MLARLLHYLARSSVRSGRRLAEDVRHGRRLEMYALFVIGVVLCLLGILAVVDAEVVDSAILATVAFLALHAEPSREPVRTDAVLRDRTDFGQFPALLADVRDLRIYGPTAVNVLVNAAEIRRRLLERGGTCRVVVQAPDPVQLAFTAAQLDESLDLEQTLQSSLNVLDRLSTVAGFQYRLLPFNPGFSLVLVDADTHDGYVIVENHGFKDSSSADRMHVRIRRSEAPRWFDYWAARFEAIWDAAAQPPAESQAGTAESGKADSEQARLPHQAARASRPGPLHPRNGDGPRTRTAHQPTNPQECGEDHGNR